MVERDDEPGVHAEAVPTSEATSKACRAMVLSSSTTYELEEAQDLVMRSSSARVNKELCLSSDGFRKGCVDLYSGLLRSQVR